MALAQVEKTPPAPVTMGEAPKPPAQPAPAGGVHFVSAARHKVLCAELRERRYLIAPVAAVNVSPEGRAPADTAYE